MPKTLLLADDSITIQKVVGITFASEDFKVITVDNGEAALRKVKELKPDVILADVVMPRKNGYELCEAVKADAELKAIPVLLLAGTFEAFDENRARAAQADGHIAKPFDSQALIAKVKELLHMPAGAPVAQPQLSPVSTAPIPVPPAAPQRPAVAPRPPAAAPRPMAAPHPGAPGRPPGPFPLGAAPRPGVPPAAMGRPPAGPGVRPPGFVPPGMAPRPPGAPAAPRPGMTGSGVPGQRPGVPGAMPPGARPFTGRVAPPSGARAPSAAPFPPRPTPAVRPPAAPMEPPAARFTPPAPAPAPIVSPTPAPVSLEDTWGELEYDRTAPAAPVFKAPPAVQPASPTTAVPESTGFTEPSPPAATETPGFPDFGPEEMAKPVELTAANEFVSAAPPAKLKDGGEAQLREALSHASREVIERIAWEVVPQLAETIIREQIDRLAKERQGQ